MRIVRTNYWTFYEQVGEAWVRIRYDRYEMLLKRLKKLVRRRRYGIRKM